MMNTERFIKMLFDEEGNAGAQNNGADNAENNGAKDNGSQGEKKYTDADVDRMLNDKFAKWQAKHQKDVDEATKLANMSAEEKATEWEKKYNDLLAENNKATLTAQATKLLADDGITGISEDIIKALVTTEAETTKANVQSFSKAVKDLVNAAVKDLSKRNAPKTGGIGKGNDKASAPITREQIEAIQDRNEKQRMIAEHMDLFKDFFK